MTSNGDLSGWSLPIIIIANHLSRVGLTLIGFEDRRRTSFSTVSCCPPRQKLHHQPASRTRWAGQYSLNMDLLDYWSIKSTDQQWSLSFPTYNKTPFFRLAEYVQANPRLHNRPWQSFTLPNGGRGKEGAARAVE